MWNKRNQIDVGKKGQINGNNAHDTEKVVL